MATSRSAFHRATLLWATPFFIFSPAPLYAQQMIFPGETWQTATPESVLVDSAKLQRAVELVGDSAESRLELVVTVNGRLIWEGSASQERRSIWSATQSLGSTVLGLAIDRDLLTLDTLAAEFIPDIAVDYPDLAMRHLVTHTSGYLAEGEIYPFVQLPPSSFIPASPLFNPPGSEFAYSGSAMDQMMNVLDLAVGESSQDFFQREIGDVIGMERGSWEWRTEASPDGRMVNDGGGSPGTSIIASADDLARLGHLFLNGGSWSGEELISKEWVAASTSVQVPASLPREGPVAGPGKYGLGWYVSPESFSAQGLYGIRLLVNPVSGLVYGRLGTETTPANMDGFERRLNDAFIPAVWDELGDGDWTHFDESNKPRWKTESGLVPDIYPTYAAIIRSNLVTVSDDLQTFELTVESGGLFVHKSATFTSGDQITLHPGSALSVVGTITAADVTVDGLFQLYGSGVVDRFYLRTGELAVREGSSLHVRRIAQSGGTLTIGGNVEIERLEVNNGRVEFLSARSSRTVSDRFEVKGDAEVQFDIGDMLSHSPVELTENVSPILGGHLVLDFPPAINPQSLEGQTYLLFDWAEGKEPSTQFTNIIYPARTTWDLSQLYTTGEVTLNSVLAKPVAAGDFNGNGILDVDDVDDLSLRIQASSTDGYYDVDGNSVVDLNDLASWVHDLKKSWIGDANLDGVFDSEDVSQILTAGEYEDGGLTNSTWATGDFNADGEFTSDDLIAALADGGYEKGLRPMAVPEPSAAILLLMGVVGILLRR